MGGGVVGVCEAAAAGDEPSASGRLISFPSNKSCAKVKKKKRMKLHITVRWPPAGQKTTFHQNDDDRSSCQVCTCSERRQQVCRGKAANHERDGEVVRES